MAKGDRLGLGLGGVVANPPLAALRLHRDPLAAAAPRRLAPSLSGLPGRPRAALLLGEGALETSDVDGLPAFSGDHLRQVEGEAIGIVELEGLFSRDHGLIPQLVEPGEPAFDRLEEALLLRTRHALDVRLFLGQLGIDWPHLGGHGTGERRERRLPTAQQPGVTHGAAQDATQHVPTPFVRRVHAVAQQERHRAGVVGEHAERRPGGPAVVGLAHHLDGVRDDRLKAVGVIIGRHALHDGRDAFQPCSGIDGRSREHGAGSVRLLIELHEHQVPDLEELTFLAEAYELFEPELFTPCSVLPAPDVHQDLRTRPARPGIPHLPEVVLVTEPEDACVGDAGDLAPQPARFVVGMVHRDIQAVGGDPEPLGARHPLPGVRDGFLLEVVAEGEVAEHLEERVVPRRVAHLLQVVVLAARPDALLAGHRAGVVAAFQPLKHPLELHHAGVGEEQRRVVGGNERGAGHLAVRPGGGREVVEELAADGGGLHGAEYSTTESQPTARALLRYPRGMAARIATLEGFDQDDARIDSRRRIGRPGCASDLSNRRSTRDTTGYGRPRAGPGSGAGQTRTSLRARTRSLWHPARIEPIGASAPSAPPGQAHGRGSVDLLGRWHRSRWAHRRRGEIACVARYATQGARRAGKRYVALEPARISSGW